VATSQAGGNNRNVSGDSIQIRNCHQLEEMRTCVVLQKEVWNFTDIDLVPLRMFVVAGKIGGQVIGAFDGKEMIAFLLAIPGAREGRSYLHSHMLGVRKEYRNAGLGRRMKLFQREDALVRGFDLIEWTFDPLEIKNAYLNIERLGAIARRYNVNQYGITSSPLQGGLPSDRLIAEWWLQSNRVTTLLNTGERPAVKVVERISVPSQIYEWKASPSTRVQAQEVQSRNRELFLKAFEKRNAVLGYERDQQGSGTFLLGKWDEEAVAGHGPLKYED
jgi:predicted GNAT superfamily acetyltransferase